jgi:molybdate-binding protein
MMTLLFTLNLISVFLFFSYLLISFAKTRIKNMITGSIGLLVNLSAVILMIANFHIYQNNKGECMDHGKVVYNISTLSLL